MTVLYSNLAQHVLSQSTNISYLIRNGMRMKTVPDDRQADYSFRDLYMTVVNTITNEMAMRAAEGVYMAPNYVRLLGFHNFANEYHGVPGVKNYSLLPRQLESRMLGALASEKSFYQIGNLLNNYESRKVEPGSNAHQELQILGEHMERRFDPKNYWHTYYQLDEHHALSEKKATAMYEVINSLKDNELSHFAVDEKGQTPKTLSGKGQAILKRLLDEHDGNLQNVFGKDWKKLTLSHKTHGSTWDRSIPELIRDGLSSRFVQYGVSRTRKSGSTLKLATAFLTNLIVLTLIGTWIDFNIVQPWQTKFAEKRGTTKEVVSPQLWSLIPATGIFVGMHFLTKKIPGYGLRFTLNMGTAFLAYSAITTLWLKHRLSQPPKGKYAELADHGLDEKVDRDKQVRNISYHPTVHHHVDNPFVNTSIHK